MGGNGGVQLGALGDAERHYDLDVEIALTKNQIFFADARPIGCDKYPDDVVFYFITQFIGFVLIERNYKVAQRVGIGLDGLFRLQELNSRRHLAGEHGRGVFIHFIK